MSGFLSRRQGQVLAGFAAGAGAVLASIFGLSFLFDPSQNDDQLSDAQLPAEVQSEDQSATNAEQVTQEDDPDAAPDTEQAETTLAEEPPEFSTFRLEPDGQMLVAGRSRPGWETTIRLDADVIATFLPDSNGDFVQFLTVDPSAQARVLSLSARSPETGEDVASDAEIIIAPLATLEGSDPDASTAAVSDTMAALEPETSELQSQEIDGADASGSDAQTSLAAPSETTETDQQETATASSDQAPDQPAVLVSDEEGIRLIQPPSDDASPEVMSVVALDTITYSQSGEVELSGRAAADGFVQVYVDNAPVITSRVEDDGNWRSELPKLESGVYTLRVDEVDAEGNVLSRVETPFQREDAQVLANALEPGQAVQAITVQPGFTLWGISRERYGDGFAYVRIFEANRDLIRNPDLIYPGQVFSLPE